MSANNTSTIALPAEYATRLTQLGTIRVTGEDAATYVQGQVTCDMLKLTAEQAQLGCHCDFKGKTWSVFYALGGNQQIDLLSHPDALAASLAELKKYGVFAKAEFADLSEQRVLFGGFGPQFEQTAKKTFGSLPAAHLQVVNNASGWVIALHGSTTRYLVALSADNTTEFDALPLMDEALWEVLDIQDGLSNVQGDNINQFVPQMMNLQALQAIDFTKGCYMGQEVVARTKYLGKNKRAAFILSADQAFDSGAGDTLEMRAGENWRRGGTVLRAARYQGQTWLLAVLANDTELGATLRLKTQPEAEFIVRPLPYTLDDE